MELTNDILFSVGETCIDVKKKLKWDFSKDGDLLSFMNFEEKLKMIASQVVDCLPLVLKKKLLSGFEDCVCRFNIRLMCNDADLGSSLCSEMQDSNKFPVAVSDVSSTIGPIRPTVTAAEVGLDHVRDVDASTASSLDSPTEMLANLNLVADDHDATSDMAVQCSESSYSMAIPEQITSELETIICQPRTREMDEPLLCLDMTENDVRLERLSSSTPEQVTDEPETTSFPCTKELDGPSMNAESSIKEDTNSGKSVISKLEKQVEPLQQLKITTRNGVSTHSLKIESLCELRPSSSIEEQGTCCEARDEVGEDGYFKLPQPPATPPNITGLRTVKTLESQKVVQCMANLLGRGGFGSVFKAHDQDTGTLLAIKRIELKEDADEVMKEVRIMNGLSHPNIIFMLGSQVQGRECQIFMEWMAGGSVEKLLDLHGPMRPMVIQRYSGQVLSALDYLHQLNILHCDVKGANIVVDSTGHVAKLCDFGLAVKMPLPKGMENRGTTPFMAHELFNDGFNSPGSDVWSMGCTMIQMATGEQPWKECDNWCSVMFTICTKDLPIPPSLPPLLKGVIADCLQRIVSMRPTARELQCRLAMLHLENASVSSYLADY